MRKQIEIFFNGDTLSSGLLEITNPHWTGKITIAPRSQLSEILKMEESQRNCVYFFLGCFEKDTDKKILYIGKSNSFSRRVRDHNRKILVNNDYKWEHLFLITSINDYFDEAIICFIETHLIQLTEKAKRIALIKNIQKKTKRKISRHHEKLAVDFINDLIMTLMILGYDFLNPTTTTLSRDVFTYTVKGITAIAEEVDDEFIVIKGSKASIRDTDRFPESSKRLRDILIAENKLIMNKTDYEFCENVTFKSPSAAACIIAASNQNGRVTWIHQKSGKNYGEWLKDKIENIL